METRPYDLVVIGAGPAGERGALTAAGLGKRVAVVERGAQIGGAVANTGTLPSKTLRETALALSGLRARKLYGVDLSLRREATVADFMHHENVVTANARERSVRRLSRYGIQVYHGKAQFLDPQRVLVAYGKADDCESDDPGCLCLHGEKILIATGSSPWRPPQFAFADPRIHDSDEILQLDRLPRTLAVVGAGVIGSEYACTFAALGARVHVVDGRSGLLPFLDHEISHALTEAMEKLGIVFHWNENVARCDTSHEVTLELTSGNTIASDQVLVAAGRSSNTAELDLAAAGITPGERGIITVDENYRTTVPNIYAAGDVIGFPALASTSMEQARVAMRHAFDPRQLHAVSPLLPTGIYTIPEASMVGDTEANLQQRGIAYCVGRANYANSARGEIIGDEMGFLKLLFRSPDLKLLGVHVMGEQASEVVHIGLMVMLSDGGADLLERACFNYPTLGNLYKAATEDAVSKRRSSAAAAER
jgi:NAD(P) transhydrogenase